MKVNISQTTTLSPPFPLPQFHINTSLPRRTITVSNPYSLRPFRRFALLRHRQNPNFKIVQGSMHEGAFMETEEDFKLLVETCITRYLSPALTLEHGLQKIKEAVEELKLNPPCSSSGIYRFQVAVPPSAKALNWFCCQPELSGVFPQFFLSKEKENPTFKSLFLNGSRGVFGIGAALYFQGSPSRALAEWSSFKRYLSVNSDLVTAYGFMDIYFDTKSSSMKHGTGSFYLFIPQIELDEFEGISFSLYQASHHFWPTTGKCHNNCIRAAFGKFNAVEDKSAQMVCVNALSVGGRNPEADSLELKEASFSSQFFARFSPNVAIANNMLDHGSEMSYSLQDFANINTLWASLMVEEFTRLGLTAPGSRSSPLAIAASTHPLTTCIACFDERSLSFHAVGYARGSHKPAIVITSSGTAVSNLYPAADRPPELQDAGANQSINQVNHFGSFVRFFYGLPAPTDDIPARMVLTTIDSAVYLATSSPCGPVHINCPFREPLDNSLRKWMLSCLKGLDFWISSADPFTKYIQLQHSYPCNDAQGQMAEVLKVIQGANQGLLLIGAIHSEDDVWAALLLAKHLLWPVVADVLSGLRLRKYFSSFSEIEEKFLFVDHLDHSLLSNSVRSWAQADVIVQIGSRITSKRISQMLEDCFPCSYIMVDKHPSRHDSSHIVTHRIQSTITQFTDCLLKAVIPPIRSKWSSFLRALDMMVAWEISFLVRSEYYLTEPYVAYVIPRTLRCETAIFVGNSMAIRDADMYGCNWAKCTHSIATMLGPEFLCHWIQVAGNRGASGIDGLLSTAIGFSVGCNKRVLCVIGDVSFLHDTNGLALLKERICRKPMTIIVINNHGGAIFSFLPIAERTEKRVLNQYFYTSHNVSIHNLCVAHGVKHVQAWTKMELQ
ncbi:hypothetical protein F0562_033059 [Nyssa sinensis]|uniref:Uncharacterized protein n=1 Tax=Nyssa sinensis TaxID=561372 RepID=A0A5J5AP99_9ASTE|nr:hypothetical protein F0562_033059 [Nyssa sinensis]